MTDVSSSIAKQISVNYDGSFTKIRRQNSCSDCRSINSDRPILLNVDPIV